MFTSNSRFTFNLQCSFESESVDMIVIVWINSSHFQDTWSGYNINDITFQEGFNFHCLSGGALDCFVIAFFLIIMLLFHNEPLTQLEILFLWWFPHTLRFMNRKNFFLQF
jgi:hypothetical protein